MIENDYSRKIIAFDYFSTFLNSELSLKSDKQFVDSFVNAGGQPYSSEEINMIMRDKGFENYELIQGNVLSTINDYLEKNPQLRIALLHLDMDVLEPTEKALELLYSRMVIGGLVIIDDYSSVEGASIAVDNFVKEKDIKLKKLSFYSVPSYFIKEN
jgi:hypothetical protein